MTRLYFEKGDAYVCLLARRPANMNVGSMLKNFGYKNVRDCDYVTQVNVGNDSAKILIRDLDSLHLVSVVSQGSTRECIDAAVGMAIIQLKLKELAEQRSYLEKHFRELLPQ